MAPKISESCSIFHLPFSRVIAVGPKLPEIFSHLTVIPEVFDVTKSSHSPETDSVDHNQKLKPLPFSQRGIIRIRLSIGLIFVGIGFIHKTFAKDVTSTSLFSTALGEFLFAFS